MTLRNVDRGRTADTLHIQMRKLVERAVVLARKPRSDRDALTEICLTLADEFDLLDDGEYPSWLQYVVDGILDDMDSGDIKDVMPPK